MLTLLAATTATSGFQFNTAFFLGLALVISEYLGTNPSLKANSIIQLVILVLRSLVSKKEQ